MSLGVLAVLGLVSGLDVDSMPLWRVGLKERLRLLGGHLETTFADGRFELTAMVPVA